MESAIVYLILAQDMSSVYQYPIFLVFLDLRKLYDSLYQGRLLKTLEGYRAGQKKNRGVLAEFRERKEVVP